MTRLYCNRDSAGKINGCNDLSFMISEGDIIDYLKDSPYRQPLINVSSQCHISKYMARKIIRKSPFIRKNLADKLDTRIKLNF